MTNTTTVADVLSPEKRAWVSRLNLRKESAAQIIDVTDMLHGRVIWVDGRQRQVTERVSRVMGYMRPVSQWNAGKQSEFRERIPYVVPQP